MKSKAYTKYLFSLLIGLSILLMFVFKIKMGSKKIYRGEAEGKNGKIVVEIGFERDRIELINIIETNETPQVANEAFREMSSKIIKNQTVMVETVTGATISSEALQNAIIDAINNSNKDINRFIQKVATENHIEEYMEKTADIVVVGGGGAGMSAAIQAAQNGDTVIILEKKDHVGGNTAISTGLYNAVDPIRQEALNIIDSEDLFFSDTYNGGDRKGNPDLIKILVENAYDGLKWLEGMGLEFSNGVDVGVGGITARGHYPKKDKSGSIYTQTLYAKCQELNIPIMTETRVTELVQNENGRIIGAKGNNNGSLVIVHARKGVILATGGFGSNVELRMKYDQRLTGDVRCSNLYGIDGDGIIMAEEVGANLVDMEYIQFYPVGDIYDGRLENGIPGGQNNGIITDMNGNRLLAEDARRDVLADYILDTPEGMIYMIVDSDYLQENIQDTSYINGLVDMGWVVKADSLPQLADILGINSANLVKTVEEYNKTVINGLDEIYGRKILINLLDTPPFYATKRAPTIHYTAGGIEINTHAQVINKKNEVIEGLFAAGEVTGGIHGPNRLGGNSLTEIIVFGRIAANSASKTEK